MNDTLINLLKTHRGIGQPKRARGTKLKRSNPGAILSFDQENIDLIAPTAASTPCVQPNEPSTSTGKVRAKKKPQAKRKSHIQKPCVSIEEWVCKSCQEEWEGAEDSGNRWIRCDICDAPFHLQCSGIEYSEEHYYEVDIDSIDFYCVECDQ